MDDKKYKKIVNDVTEDTLPWNKEVTLTHLHTLISVTVGHKSSQEENRKEAQEQLLQQLEAKGWFSN